MPVATSKRSLEAPTEAGAETVAFAKQKTEGEKMANYAVFHYPSVTYGDSSPDKGSQNWLFIQNKRVDTACQPFSLSSEIT